MPIDYSQEIETVDTIDYDEFQERFMKPQKPVKIKNLLSDSKANKIWSPDYFKEKVGDVEVGVFDNDPCYLDRSFKEGERKMKFTEYMDLITSGPTDARLHLFNVFKHAPETRNDFEIPDKKIFIEIEIADPENKIDEELYEKIQLYFDEVE